MIIHTPGYDSEVNLRNIFFFSLKNLKKIHVLVLFPATKTKCSYSSSTLWTNVDEFIHGKECGGVSFRFHVLHMQTDMQPVAPPPSQRTPHTVDGMDRKEYKDRTTAAAAALLHFTHTGSRTRTRAEPQLFLQVSEHTHESSTLFHRTLQVYLV